MDTKDSSLEQRARQLREAGAEELLRSVRGREDELHIKELRQLLLNPHVPTELLADLGRCRPLLSSYEARSALAAHPRLPQPVALSLVPTLFWRDLAKLSTNVRVAPVVRRAAAKHLEARLPRLAVGERISLARLAGPEVLRRMMLGAPPAVLTVLLDNPRLSEAAVLDLVRRRDTNPKVLDLVGRHPRWSVRYEIRKRLCEQPMAPFRLVLQLLPALRQQDLQKIRRLNTLSSVVRRRAEELVSARGGGSSGPFSRAARNRIQGK